MKKKANCVAKRFLVKGEPRIFLIATKKILAGEILYLNYGDGYKDKDFIFKIQDENF